ALLPAALLAAVLTTTVFAETEQSVRWLAAIGIAAAPLSVSWAVDIGALVGAGRYRAVFLMRVTQPVLVLAALIPLWLNAILTPATVLAMYQLGSVATAILGFALVRTSFRGR